MHAAGSSTSGEGSMSAAVFVTTAAGPSTQRTASAISAGSVNGAYQIDGVCRGSSHGARDLAPSKQQLARPL
jgi:hypothetical protein